MCCIHGLACSCVRICVHDPLVRSLRKRLGCTARHKALFLVMSQVNCCRQFTTTPIEVLWDIVGRKAMLVALGRRSGITAIKLTLGLLEDRLWVSSEKIDKKAAVNSSPDKSSRRLERGFPRDLKGSAPVSSAGGRRATSACASMWWTGIRGRPCAAAITRAFITPTCAAASYVI